MGSGSTKHPFADVAISFLSCGNEDKSLLSIDSYLSPSSNPEHGYFAGTLSTSGIWTVGFRKKQDELRWKQSAKERPAVCRVQLLWHWMSISGAERPPSEKQQVCCWWSHKYRAQEGLNVQSLLTQTTHKAWSVFQCLWSSEQSLTCTNFPAA